ncbi:hypothetical protein [Streptomyces sp. GQFP]|uniref:hypothetical protein n=1 Tax=Streptomyces sp. GQFP TaxID=2907545 RepID=UPI001F2060E2|nr:hypothetical protein [Streptomyces sp. GQFP]UIX34219.1 hypothetical protein LUX31_31790 [Streptomyces sp. GQFP]
MAALIAAASLAFTAWGTWKSAQVADDQLIQSREARGDEQRRQAALITWWQTDDGSIFIANRSVDAAFGALETEPWYLPAKDRKIRLDGGSWTGSYLASNLSIPPCTRMEISDSLSGPDADATARIRGMMIWDAAGRRWFRTSHGLGSPDAHVEQLPPLTFEGLEFGKAKLTELDYCGSSPG